MPGTRTSRHHHIGCERGRERRLTSRQAHCAAYDPRSPVDTLRGYEPEVHWKAFPRGELVDLSGARGAARHVRAEVIAAAARGGARRAGQDRGGPAGRRAGRRAAALGVFLALATLVFGLHHPPALAGVPHPAFNPFVYSVDLLVPLVNFGLRDAYDPQ